VDTSFLSQVQPNMSGVQQALERVALAESEKSSQQGEWLPVARLTTRVQASPTRVLLPVPSVALQRLPRLPCSRRAC